MITGDPDAVEAAAAGLTQARALTDAAAAVDAVTAVALAGWEGQAAAAASEAFSRFGPALVAGDEACRAVAPVLRAYAAELRAAREQYDRAQAVADQADPTAPPSAIDEAARATGEANERVRIADERAADAIAEVQGQLGAMAAAPPGAASGGAPTVPPPTDEPGLMNTLGHTALDVVGLVPVVGEVADVANAAWYGLEGDYLAAGLSLAAAIPIAGWAFTGGKLGVKGVDTVKAVTDAGGAAAWVKGRPSMVPWNAERLPYRGVGEKYKWTDPATKKTVTYHAHPADSAAPGGSNSANGPVYRLKVGNRYVDGTGKPYTRNELNARSPVYDAQGANDTHIPYPTNQPVGWDPGRRVFIPNGASAIDGTGGQEGGAQ